MSEQASDTALANDAFDRVYRRHAGSAFRRARRLLGNEDDAAEVVHDVFLDLLENPTRFRGQSALSTYLYSAITHACLNRIRNRTTRLRLLRERFFGGLLARPPQGDPEALSSLRSALQRMPEPLGEVAVYCYLDGLTHEEIARILGCSPRKVSDHVGQIARWAQREESSLCRI